MYSSKLSRLLSALHGRTAATVRGVAAPSPAARSSFSWTATRKRRTSDAGAEDRRDAAPGHVSTRRASGASGATVDPGELRRFQALAGKWWDENGEFGALHAMNDLRVPFIRDNLLNVHRARHPGKPLAGLRILDVGCGGGLLTEPLARLGAEVLGIDPVEDSVATAQLHSSHDPELAACARYRACTLEELSAGGEEEEEGAEEGAGQGAEQFDAVVASEVVEHLADLETFAFCCSHVLKPGGSLFITTINRTSLSYALAVVAAERLLRLVPAGTHDWDKFVSPEELERLLESNGLSVQAVRGMLYNPLSGAWSWTGSTSVNYALHALKPPPEPEPEPAAEP